MVQRGFAETATKQELQAAKDDLGGRVERLSEDVKILRNDMEAGFQAITNSMAAIVDKLNLIRQDIVELHDLRARVERLEKKVGLRR